MRPSERIEIFSNRFPLVGPVFWIVSVQYFLTMALVAEAWAERYNFFTHTISDLGNSACGLYDGRFVCSPGYTWMNASFIVLGATMIAGSSLIYQSFRKSTGSLIGFTFMALAGLGTILVGLFPENTVGELHYIGALMAFLLGDLALIILGLSLDLPKAFKYFTIVSGVISLIALLLFATENYLGLGIGGMERFAGHPQTIWLIAFGIYMSKDRFKELASRAGTKLKMK